MGCVNSTQDEKEAKQRSAAIDRQLRQSAKEYDNTIKILLLGDSLSTHTVYMYTFHMRSYFICVHVHVSYVSCVYMYTFHVSICTRFICLHVHVSCLHVHISYVYMYTFHVHVLYVYKYTFHIYLYIFKRLHVLRIP